MGKKKNFDTAFEKIGLQPGLVYSGADALIKVSTGLTWKRVARTTKCYIVFVDGSRVSPQKVSRVRANVGGQTVYFR